jgi:ABC-type amino acid transport substrate-binding protein
MKFSKLLFSSVVAVSVLGFTAVAAHAEDLLDSVKQAGVLKIGLEGTYPPFDSRNSAGELEGFDVDVARLSQPGLASSRNSFQPSGAVSSQACKPGNSTSS